MHLNKPIISTQELKVPCSEIKISYIELSCVQLKCIVIILSLR